MISTLWLGQLGLRGRRIAAAVRLAWLGPLIYAILSGSPAPGRGSLALLALASLAWVGWVAAWEPVAGGAAGQPVAGRSGRPWLTVAISGTLGVAGGLLVGLARGGGYGEVFPAVGVFIASIRLAPVWSAPVLAASEAAVACGFVIGQPAVHHAPVGGLLPAALILAAVYLAGLSRREFLLRQGEDVRLAALAERNRIAREVHDVLAHSLAGLNVQLEAARVLLAEKDDAKAALTHVERAHRLGSEGLAETRRAIAALREDSRPLPDLLAELVGGHGPRQDADGAATTLAVRGTARTLPADVTLTIYRAAQEALTNAVRHAPGSAIQAELRYEPGQTVLTVTNTRPAGSGTAQPRFPRSALPGRGRGYGLTGMRERAELAGGTLSAGPRDSGWQVELRVPA